MDIFDHTRTYQNEVVRCSLSSPLLMHAICALSAKQMSLIQNKFLWEPLASKFYGESLRLLIKELANHGTDRELLLAATIILGSYELLAEPGVDYQKHLYGARTLIQSFKIRPKESRLQQASFWIYARQDVALALVNERPTLTSPDQWPPLPKHASSVEEMLGNQVLQLLAKIIELKFSQNGDPWSGERLEALKHLLSEIDSLWANIPHHVRGVPMRNVVDESEGLLSIWFCDPAAGNLSFNSCLGGSLMNIGAACLYYHMAKILAFECLIEGVSDITSSEQTQYLGSIHLHARQITSICLSADLSDGAMVVAVNPAFYGIVFGTVSINREELTRHSGKIHTLISTEDTAVGDFGLYRDSSRILHPR